MGVVEPASGLPAFLGSDQLEELLNAVDEALANSAESPVAHAYRRRYCFAWNSRTQRLRHRPRRLTIDSERGSPRCFPGRTPRSRRNCSEVDGSICRISLTPAQFSHARHTSDV